MKTTSLLDTVLAVADHARTILPATDVHGVDEVQKHFGVGYTPEQLATLVTLPWSEAVLRKCTGTHLLVAGYPLSVLEMWKQYPHMILQGWGGPAFWEEEPCISERRVEARWYLIRKEPIPGTLAKTYPEQCRRLPRSERVLWACELLYGALLHRLETGTRLLSDYDMRCQDVDKSGYRRYVQDTCAPDRPRDDGLYVNGHHDDEVDTWLGLASGLKS